ncbi:aspartyl/glutamyl-tRNA(Asn/Gln) amidotransferase subunit A [Peptoclostridium litorale DSM 5388]|uniref:Glutamyl-tRNA(Gln) amidotransferase subunit A n=2 Tax=Peptoclostridium litorale TaxID=1557 RepID=A0A069RFX0_PEPLI|nr:glutamyl-tRNA(Gln) amidotransferase subunit A [Peptoclostridium litorale DSM 5388]SIO01124.1 aspartyl/glutamyl-tRNA(Asn/Gln) amidotransferase subunit A [Peptoclostridium litorale DSM 5388]
MLKDKEISSYEITKASIDRIGKTEPKLDAFLTLTAESALEKAKMVDEKRAKGEALSDIAGVPMSIKDNICTKGINTTCASKILKDFVPPYNATVVDMLNAADAVLVGKTNLDEFAMGGSTENSAFKITKNPWDTTRVPGGSSGGSAVSVASGQVFYSLGSDTGGSVRQPASFNGIVGLKPTYGRVSRYGLVAFASSLDQVGIFTRDTEDCAMVLSHIAGKDKMDGTSVDAPVADYAIEVQKDSKGMKVGVPKELLGEGIDPVIRQSIIDSVQKLEQAGIQWEEISMPHLTHNVETYYIIAPSEASSNLARYDGIKYGYRTGDFETLEQLYKRTRSEGFGPEVKRRIMMGTYTLSAGYYDAYYKKALQVRTLIKNDFMDAFSKYDAIITPTVPNTAFKIGEKINDPLSMYLEDLCTIPVNMAGLPAVSIPCGFDSNGMPIGMQIIGKHFDEAKILRIARAFENITDYKDKRAEI